MTTKEMPNVIRRRSRSVEYMYVVRQLARQHKKGMIGEALPDLLSVECVNEINRNVPCFQALVSCAHKQMYGY